ncbi:site-specific DNA-methyltransferase [Methylobacillus caricis]|uniref:site-specific DNA-methyltransferase n=1 Tax=Methylobacillus caricis TaxID=1971611 RepID=UPI001CFFE921|nr:site-specific DNA-methyltransferase [Methylobacillus caricis]MCB5188650.1 site-specific DNA-methyltransferase [Methylobacillus caricis]
MTDEKNTEIGYSPDALAERQMELLTLIRQAAPEVISDNQIDIERLKELLGQEFLAPAEHYELSWAGKAAARREIQKTTSYTLLPTASNPEQAPHMLIEGENLEVLRVLQKSYYGKVKMIYIDPPYNTGNDSFVYPDDYSETLEEYQKRTGELSEVGYLNKQTLWKKNSKESGQYHSAWLSMMYPRLYLARNLLRDDGVIFISINDHEMSNLRTVCDELFGVENSLTESPTALIWQQSGTTAGHFANAHEYILCYAKNKSILPFFKLEDFGENDKIVHGALKKISKANPASEITFPVGMGFEGESAIFTGTIGGSEKQTIISKEMRFVNGKLAEAATLSAGWGMKEQIQTWIIGEPTYDSKGQKLLRFYFNKEGILWYEKERGSIHPKTIINKEIGTTKTGSAELRKIFGFDPFGYPKPSSLIKWLASFTTTEGDIILDFFAGSGTTAQAVMELNLEGGGNRQCICVQLPEALEETSEAYKAGYRTIADITRARIDKVITKLKAEHPDKTTDLACAHFTLAPSNFKVWRSDIVDTDALRAQLDIFQRAEKNSTEKNGKAIQDVDVSTAMLAELLLKYGLGALGVHAISKPRTLAGVTVHRVLMQDDRQLWLCFESYTEALKDEIVKARPAQVILLNSCFIGDKADELLSNLQLEMVGLDIGLLVI